ncbi:hypothetical protein AX15_005785 [Amanita polypyramis BW_CC]|nr:hypothetical protein AX15_005785 [Amanita polypyramis BW_CC]
MEQLDVEDEEQRQRRILKHLEKLNASSSAKIPSPPLKFDFGNRTTCLVAPPTELLARVQAFLPQIEASNAVLVQQVEADPESVNMEHVDDSMEQYIEMNLGLGVFEDRSRKNGAETLSSSDSSSVDDDDDNTDDDGCCSDTSTDAEASGIATSLSPIQRLIRPLPKRGPASRLNRPNIHVMDDDDCCLDTSADAEASGIATSLSPIQGLIRPLPKRGPASPHG